MNLFLTALLIWGVMIILFSLTWLLQQRLRNAGIVDLLWTFATGAAGILLVFQGEAPMFRKLIIASIVTIWSLRLGIYLWQRISSEPEDGRYSDMRDQWGDQFEIKMFVFFQLQAVWTILFAIPMLSAAMNPAESLLWTDIVGMLFFVVSVVGEAIADSQLARFKSDPNSSGKVCRVGLWGYSRHPNYFFEWLHWFSYLFISIGTWWLIGGISGVVVMYLFLTRVTGIPITEKRIMKTRKSEYETYQEEVSPFFPLPNKS